jgi:hypothetical protein
MIPIRMSTIRHHPCGHHRACNNSGDAERETLCCMVRSRSAFSTRRLVIGLSSVAKRRGVDLGATLVRRQVAVRRIVEKDGHGKPQPVCDYAGFAPFGFGYRRCPGEQLTIQVFEDFLRKVWRDKIVFRRLNLANPGWVPIGPNAVIEDNIGFARPA